jgi:histidinol-phosphate aminotransferase
MLPQSSIRRNLCFETGAMADMADWMTTVVRGLRAPMSHARPGANGPALALNLNESPIPPSPRAIAAATAAVAGVNRYPPTDGGTLVAALAAHTGVPADRIGVAVGSDMLLHLLCMIALAPGRSAVFPFPSFPRYGLSTRIAGARAIPVPLGRDGANDPAALAAAVADDTSILFCCTPNGNTGGAIPPEALRRLARAVPPHVMLVVDEAYAEFDPDADTLACLSERDGPWAVTRTFSKAYALAGLRVGYVLCSGADVAEALRAVRPIFEMTSPALAAAEAALGDAAHLAHMLELTRAGRGQLVAGLAALGFDPLPSRANFVTTDLGRPAAPVVAAMARRGVLVRTLADPGFEHYLRITVGLREENAQALDALAAALGEETRKEVSSFSEEKEAKRLLGI